MRTVNGMNQRNSCDRTEGQLWCEAADVGPRADEPVARNTALRPAVQETGRQVGGDQRQLIDEPRRLQAIK